jgi:dihydroxyacetone kinase-like protein
MGQILHDSATTTHAIRAAIQRSKATAKALGERVNAASGTMGVALTNCTVPAAGKPTFEIGENELEMGVGIHGEPGRKHVAMMSANAIAKDVIGAICDDIKPGADQEVFLLVNGMAGHPAARALRDV